MATSAIITISSLLLFGYWFRYTCMLLLSARTTRDYSAQVVADNQLSFLRVQSELREGAAVELDRLHDALERDYAVVTYLLKHMAHSSEESPLEALMLAMNYRLMGAWFRVSRRFSLQASRRALEEMSMVVAHFANTMGERAACAAGA